MSRAGYPVFYAHAVLFPREKRAREFREMVLHHVNDNYLISIQSGAIKCLALSKSRTRVLLPGRDFFAIITNFQLELIVTAIHFPEHHLLQTEHLFRATLLLVQLHLNNRCFNPAWRNKMLKNILIFLCAACDKIKRIR